jgi:hypothetical protein
MPVSHSAASELQAAERDKWPSVHWRFLTRESSMLMKRLYLQARNSTSAKPLLNISLAILKRPFFSGGSRNIESFLYWHQKRGRVVPRFVERELRAFLDCGILALGFVRVHCDICHKDRAVHYSYYP